MTQVVDKARPFIIEQWVNGQWSEVGRAATIDHARQLRNAMKASNQFSLYRVIRVVWVRQIDYLEDDQP